MIEEKDFPIERIQMVKDLFIFSCYTGLAYVDVSNLTPASIVTGPDGDQWISTSRKKTRIPVKVPLLPKALAIIEKYRNHPKPPDRKSVVTGKSVPERIKTGGS